MAFNDALPGLFCSPTPRVSWDRLDGDMPSRARQESFGQELVIEDVQLEDNGMYECQGISEQAQIPIRRSFDLSVEGKFHGICKQRHRKPEGY